MREHIIVNIRGPKPNTLQSEGIRNITDRPARNFNTSLNKHLQSASDELGGGEYVRIWTVASGSLTYQRNLVLTDQAAVKTQTTLQYRRQIHVKRLATLFILGGVVLAAGGRGGTDTFQAMVPASSPSWNVSVPTTFLGMLTMTPSCPRMTLNVS